VSRGRESGFTLIELSIVLVIIGLIVGGILTGQSLIAAAAVRAQISQIEKFNTAANTFRDKYGYLPGDIPAGPAALFGFASRGQYAGEGDGNGVLEGIDTETPPVNYGTNQDAGENAMFWVDLSTAHLIDGGFKTASATAIIQPATNVSLWLPKAKLGGGNYVYTWSLNGRNYFSISVPNQGIITNFISNDMPSVAGLTVNQAYGIDAKIDDGLPGTGNVRAQFVFWYAVWSASYPYSDYGTPPNPSVAPASSVSCFDNGGNSSSPYQYSLTQNNGNGVNCGISFKMQAGD
jgi:prepilin-type N-terminal cleavage/methylation domain-containing protein